MTTLTGTYYDGNLKLDRPLKTSKPIKVTITLLEEDSPGLTLSDFSFIETQELLKDCKSSFSDEVIEERRRELRMFFLTLHPYSNFTNRKKEQPN